MQEHHGLWANLSRMLKHDILRSDSLIIAVESRCDVVPTCAFDPCGAQKLGPTENLFHVTLLHQFKELRSARWKSIDSKYVRAAWSFDEAQLSQRSNQAENLTSPLFML